MKITDTILYIGVNDHEVDLFEGQYVVPNGMAYNSYAILDEKTAIMDTVDARFTEEWLSNIEKALDGKAPDYLVVQHMEPDHSANIDNFMKKYPEAKIVSSAKAFAMMQGFFGTDYPERKVVVGEGDTLCLGAHTLTFVTAPMVHWPEVIVTYDSLDKVLFSADGFGKFGALDVEEDWACEARRYYIGIVGKYGPQVQALLGKAAGLEINMICPLHGPVIRSDFGFFLDKYQKWSTYEPEEKAVMIAYGSIYGGTAAAADILANKLAERGVKNITVYDTSATHSSYILADAFRCSHLVFASATYNNNIFSTMEHLLHELKAHNLSNRTVALIQNGTWGPNAGKQMRELLEGMKNMNILDGMVTIKSRLAEGQMSELDALADAIVASMQA